MRPFPLLLKMKKISVKCGSELFTYPCLLFVLMLYLMGLPIWRLFRKAPFTYLSNKDRSSFTIVSSSKLIIIIKIPSH
jgi:hypothetical protein